MPTLPTHTAHLLRRLALALVFLLGAVFLAFHVRLIVFPYQHEYREGAILLTTQAFLDGLNPYDLEINPLYINVYGFVYNWIALPLAALFGNTLALHRVISAAAIAGQILLVMAVLRRQQVSWLLAGAAGLFIWAGQFYYVSPLARPDAVGEFFFLASLFIPWLGSFSWRSIAAGIVMAVLGFYTKPYFILGLPPLLVYIFLVVSKRRALMAGLAATGGFLLSLLLVHRMYEAYFLNIIYSHIADLNESIDYLIMQSLKFLRDYWSFWAIVVVELALRLKPRRAPTGHAAPLKLDYTALCLAFTTALIVFKLGRHTGNSMVYFYQFLTPFIVILFLRWVQTMTWQRGFVTALVLANLVSHTVENLRADLRPYHNADWLRLEQALEGRQSILNTPVSVSLHIARKQEFTNSGQTQYFFPLPDEPSFYYPAVDRLHQVGDDWRGQVRGGVRSGAFDLVMLEDPEKANSMEGMQEHYRLAEQLTIAMPHTWQAWPVYLYTRR